MNGNRFLGLWLLAICCIAFPLFSSDTVYVGNISDGTVSVVDADTNTVIDTIFLGGAPAMIAATPDGTKIYVTNISNSGFLYVIDTTTLTAEPIDVGELTQALAITPDGSYVYVPVPSSTNNTIIQVIDTSSDTIAASVDTGVSFPSPSITITPDGTKAYIVAPTINVVIAIDTATNEITEAIPVGITPVYTAITPDSTKAYVTNTGDGTVSVIDVATDEVTKTIPGVGSPYTAQIITNSAISPDGSFLYVPAYDDGTVAVINTVSNTVVTTIEVGTNPQFITISSDGSYGYVSNVADNTISVIDLEINAEIDTIAVGNSPFQPILNTDNSRLYVPNTGSNTLSVIDTTTKEVTATIPVGTSPFFSVFISSQIPTEEVQPPENLRGYQRTDRFLTQTILRNTLTWQAPSTGPAVALYRIYADPALTELLGTVEGNAPLQFSFSVGEKKRSYTYYVVSVDGQGNESIPLSVQITP